MVKMRRKRTVKSRLIRLGFYLLFFALVGWICLDYVAPYMIIGKQNRTDNRTPESIGLKYEAMRISTRDSLELDAFYIPSSLDTTYGTFLVLHGIGACKEYMFGIASALSQEGIAVLLYDSRGHGKSTGEFLTYGFLEKHDVSDIITHLDATHPTKRYGIWGVSYGGAVALQAMAIEPRIDIGVIESTFSTVREIVFDYKKRMLGIGWHWVSDRVLERGAEIAGFDPEQVKPEESCKQIKQPIIMAHGSIDGNISVEYGKRNFANLASHDKEFVLLEGGNHNDMWHVGGQAYGEKLLGFIRARWAK
jgi:pimeloyl-ACP methyl ester carboxylesterase